MSEVGGRRSEDERERMIRMIPSGLDDLGGKAVGAEVWSPRSEVGGQRSEDERERMIRMIWMIRMVRAEGRRAGYFFMIMRLGERSRLFSNRAMLAQR